MIILDKFATHAVTTAIKIAGADVHENATYIKALDDNWSEVVESIRNIQKDTEEAIQAFGESNGWTKKVFETTYTLECSRIARLILKSVTNE